ncbi:twin-arginine translocase subunit TatC [Candidatus Purcelliella pentastirinorum]|uniref:twin-arginine translocase subunit TatC n=1 Tax=Candidatus Purcelliella pentastirinorum TaxID=472834 RepID=UPI0023681564|nr:twin-arginine translocase subunit TatC [Candidatus Purcelliella pentastirinorum]WDI78868.1 twin-arginine translocase subunit TatC [Candidatus Purcelliella pentastirinorum]WDR80001.1 twin-arginine translocase subunit TatC [Candidatus Purcelliella pentastirinorum]
MSNEIKLSIINHLIELRKRIINCIVIIITTFLILSYFSNYIYHIIAIPLIKLLPYGTKMIAINISSPLFTPIKLTFILSILITMPFNIYQIWKFISPALYKKEKKIIKPLIFFSFILFYSGIIFTYYIIMPVLFMFLTKTVPNEILITADISNYLDFIMKLFITFGISFEIPILILLLCIIKIINTKTLKNNRSYILIITFIISMLVTPPDILSQIILALPMYILFEIGILFSTIYENTIQKVKEK